VKGPSKYRAQPVTVNGIRFASKREASRWFDLILLERAGEISNLRRQYRYPLQGPHGPLLTPTGRQMHYVADFVYEENGKLVIEDAKGFPTPEYKLKRAIMVAMGLTIREV
jgi:hypothetical protein